MVFKKSCFYLILLFLISKSNAQSKAFVIHTVAFYNFENCFDTINDPIANDEDWTPTGSQHWNTKKYKQKLENLARVLSEIGTGENPNSPTFIGGAEIENQGVLEDLIKQPKLMDKDYGIIHFDSPDKRGIDVALLYQKKQFQPTSYINIPLYVYKGEQPTKEVAKTDLSDNVDNEDIVQISTKNHRVYTRDQLLVTGFLNGEEIHIIVNHWPSRAGGEKKSSPFREAAGALNKKIIDSLQRINPNTKVITMGDLNDSPFNNSVKKTLEAKGKMQDVGELEIYNPFEEMANKGLGTIAFRDAWDIFDQVMVSGSLLQKDYSSFQYWKAGIYNKTFLIQQSGKYKGYPLRHSLTEIGFSDHFPVYIYLIKEKK
ncbi:endonuclease/exonuclease/phosphatase family protein [Flavobacterium taihuense]|uniref:Endonuclease/exonuclease/phosphatase family protein n=1 Tax=Flavobacterium taihuense TaxID=2857508 RepID=A0ABS6XQX1_9FLAO|nr:endonuclease/exonuclease/phosphatase family protein [Flavobacterium taihuense]MBW4359004.1 endonuclease/exonuclease/phosphatase family protein [Flavobacterium taihuense]